MQMTVQEGLRFEPTGAKDGGNIIVSCSNCQAALLDIYRTRPQEKDVWKVRATCPFCGCNSYAVEVQGGFHPAGYGVIKPDDPNSVVASTRIGDIRIDGDTFFFDVIKENANALPIKL